MKVGRRLAITAVVLCILPGGVFSAGTEGGDEEEPRSFIKNSSFEEQKKGKPLYWNPHFWPREAGIEKYICLSREQVRDGEWALKLDARPPLEPKKSLCFNGTVEKDILETKGKPLILSGWVYAPENAGSFTISFRVRMWGKDEDGKTKHLGDVASIYATTKPGEWVRFEKTGMIPAGKPVLSLDLHCNAKTPDAKAICYVDNVRLFLKEESAAKTAGSGAK
jgi:hypothetical protein